MTLPPETSYRWPADRLTVSDAPTSQEEVKLLSRPVVSFAESTGGSQACPLAATRHAVPVIRRPPVGRRNGHRGTILV